MVIKTRLPILKNIRVRKPPEDEKPDNGRPRRQVVVIYDSENRCSMDRQNHRKKHSENIQPKRSHESNPQRFQNG